MSDIPQNLLQVDSVKINYNKPLPSQSANSLFRFFKEPEYLLETLKESALKPRYYPETVDYLDIDEKYIAYPMICFCDINLHKMSEHIKFYGSYGIAFSKDWGIDKGIQPIQYINSKSPLCKDFSEAFNYAIKSNEENPTQNFLLSQMYFFKPIRGTMKRDGEDVFRLFTDECEWRYVPDLSSLNLPQAVTSDEIYSLPILNNAISLNSKAWLKFNCDEIKYIIVRDESTLNRVCKLLNKKIKKLDRRNRLISKIIVWEREKGDF